jgi:hypothetical protein
MGVGVGGGVVPLPLPPHPEKASDTMTININMDDFILSLIASLRLYGTKFGRAPISTGLRSLWAETGLSVMDEMPVWSEPKGFFWWGIST